MGLLPPKPPPRDHWTATRWPLVKALDAPGEPRRVEAWEHLVAAYRSPMEGYVQRVLTRKRGRLCSQEEAAEVVQDFLGDGLAKAWLSRADPERGPFRAFLQTVLRRYARGRVRAERAKRRGPSGAARLVSLADLGPDEPGGADEQPDVDALDRTWAEVAVQRARARLGRESDRYLHVVDDLIRTNGATSPDLAQQISVRAQQLPVVKHRALKRFAQLFGEELAATVGDDTQFRDEWRRLAPYLP